VSLNLRIDFARGITNPSRHVSVVDAC